MYVITDLVYCIYDNSVNTTVDSEIVYAYIHFGKHLHILTRNTFDCDQSNYSSHTVFSHIPIEFWPNWK